MIPAIQASRHGEVVTLASRDTDRACKVARELGIANVATNYDALLADPLVDAVYIPLPNHLHLEWTLRALETGKHVLCEKPLGMNAAEVQALVERASRYPDLHVAEAFMYRHHPQWTLAHSLTHSGDLGRVLHVHVHFSYANLDPDNIRNQLALGGGALMDIGCYGVNVARWMFGREPIRVCAQMIRDPEFGTDALTTLQLNFGCGTASVTCGTQMERHQVVEVLFSDGSLRVPLPFNAPPNEPQRIEVTRSQELMIHAVEAADQYMLQANEFAVAVRTLERPLNPLVDSVRNMGVIDACFESARESRWVAC